MCLTQLSNISTVMISYNIKTTIVFKFNCKRDGFAL